MISFGIVLWEILTKEEPYQEYETFEEFRNAVCFQHARPQIPSNCHPSLRKLIECCWDPNPQKRPSFPVIVQALEHIIVEYAILDEIGKRLWKERFLKRVLILFRFFLFIIIIIIFIIHFLFIFLFIFYCYLDYNLLLLLLFI